MPRTLDPDRRRLDRGWRDRHIQGQADGTMPPGQIQLRYEDGEPVFDRLGRPRIWSSAVEIATRSRPSRADLRAVARQAARAADAARVAEEAARVRREARLGIVPPDGRLAAVDAAALLVIGPLGAIGCSSALTRTFEVLARGGRHPVEALVATGWRDEATLDAAVEAFRPRLAAIGLRICRRKAGWRLAAATV